MDDEKQEIREALISQFSRTQNLLEGDVPLTTAVSGDYLKIALAAYENARIDGLCHDGAWECALTAVPPSDPETHARLLAQLDSQLQNR